MVQAIVKGYISLMQVKKQICNGIFKNSNVSIPYKTIQSLLAYKQLEYTDKCSGNCVYALARPECGKLYLGQTDISFKTRFKEYFQYHTHQNVNSKFSQHHQEGHHCFWPTRKYCKLSGKVYDCFEKKIIYREKPI